MREIGRTFGGDVEAARGGGDVVVERRVAPLAAELRVERRVGRGEVGVRGRARAVVVVHMLA